METIIILSSIGALAFLGKVGLIAYEVLQMDFNFDQPWPEDVPQSSREIALEQHSVPNELPPRKIWIGRFVPAARLHKG